jgi:hypothetical protein
MPGNKKRKLQDMHWAVKLNAEGEAAVASSAETRDQQRIHAAPLLVIRQVIYLRCTE